MRIVDCEQGSPEWLKARTGLVTASRFKDARSKLAKGAASAAQLDYMASLAIERLTGDLSDTFVTPAMQRGTELENEARACYEAETGAFVTQAGICLHDSLPFGYSPDGLVGEDGLIEIKCPANAYKLAQLYITRDVSEYMDQMQGGMWITGRRWCDMVPYHPRLPMRPIRVERDQAYIDKLVLDLHSFMNSLDDYTKALRKAAA